MDYVYGFIAVAILFGVVLTLASWRRDFIRLKGIITYYLWADYVNGLIRYPSYTVSTLPDASDNERRMVYVSNETGGATMAFSDGTNWRRIQDRAVVS